MPIALSASAQLEAMALEPPLPLSLKELWLSFSFCLRLLVMLVRASVLRSIRFIAICCQASQTLYCLLAFEVLMENPSDPIPSLSLQVLSSVTPLLAMACKTLVLVWLQQVL